MTWKRTGPGSYQRRCGTCDGSGVEKLDHRWTRCAECPYDKTDLVDHPSNTANHPEDAQNSVWHNLVRCNVCGMFWCVWFENDDDSVDCPAPEPLGMTLPDDDWTPRGKST